MCRPLGIRVVAVLVTSLLAGAAGAAEYAAERSLSRAERADLEAGETVTRRVETSSEDAGLGVLAYQLVNASPTQVLSALSDVNVWPEFMPRTQSARVLWEAGDLRSVELVQGTSLVQAKYAVRVQREPDGIRFWLDRSRPHDIDAVWGYFRVRRFDAGRSLLTVGVMLDMGGGLFEGLLRGRVRQAIAATPAQICGFLEPHPVALIEARPRP